MWKIDQCGLHDFMVVVTMTFCLQGIDQEQEPVLPHHEATKLFCCKSMGKLIRNIGLWLLL